MTTDKLNRDDLKSGQKAAIVIRLFYEEERRKAGGRKLATLVQNSDDPNLDQREQSGRTYEILAKKAGIGKSSMANLLAVYKSRDDLFERVFNGEISINKAYTQMKAVSKV